MSLAKEGGAHSCGGRGVGAVEQRPARTEPVPLASSSVSGSSSVSVSSSSMCNSLSSSSCRRKDQRGCADGDARTARAGRGGGRGGGRSMWSARTAARAVGSWLGMAALQQRGPLAGGSNGCSTEPRGASDSVLSPSGVESSTLVARVEHVRVPDSSNESARLDPRSARLERRVGSSRPSGLQHDSTPRLLDSSAELVRVEHIPRPESRPVCSTRSAGARLVAAGGARVGRSSARVGRASWTRRSTTRAPSLHCGLAATCRYPSYSPTGRVGRVACRGMITARVARTIR